MSSISDDMYGPDDELEIDKVTTDESDNQEDNEPAEEVQEEPTADDEVTDDTEDGQEVEQETESIPNDDGKETKSDSVPVKTYIEMREERNALRDRLAALENAKADNKEPEKEPDTDDDGEELITASKARQIAEEAAARATEAAINRTRQEQQASRLDASEELARAKFTAAECGEGLDYDSVVSTGKNSLTAEDRNAILQSSDPGAEIYKRCIDRSPALKRLASIESAAKVAKVQKPVIKQTKKTVEPPPLREASGEDIASFLYD